MEFSVWGVYIEILLFSKAPYGLRDSWVASGGVINTLNSQVCLLADCGNARVSEHVRRTQLEHRCKREDQNMEACKCEAGSSWLRSVALCQGSWTFEKRWTELGCSRQGSTGLLFSGLYVTILYYYNTILP